MVSEERISSLTASYPLETSGADLRGEEAYSRDAGSTLEPFRCGQFPLGRSEGDEKT